MFISVSLLSPEVSVSAKVIRSSISYSANEAGPYGMGVEFRAISNQDQELISIKIEEHLKSEDINWREEEASEK
jgi:hypothetical protein